MKIRVEYYALDKGLSYSRKMHLKTTVYLT